MPIPLSGSFSMGDIISEIGAGFTTPKRLNSMAAGEYVPLNSTSPYPVSKLPGEMTSMSDWRGYDHGFKPITTTTTTTTTTTASPCFDHNLGYDEGMAYIACSSPLNIFQTDNAVFSLSTVIYTECQRTTAPPGFYADGTNWLYFDGNDVTLSGSCERCIKIFLSFSSESGSLACDNFSVTTKNYFIDVEVSNFTAARFIGRDCGIKADPGFYSDGVNWLEWRDGVVLSSGTCESSSCFEHNVFYDGRGPCEPTEPVVVYTNAEVFAESTLIFLDSGCTEPAPDGFYTDDRRTFSLEVSRGEVMKRHSCR